MDDTDVKTVGLPCRLPRAAAFCALVAVLGLVAFACSDPTIDPFSNDGRYFTVYGYLDAQSTRHQVRVVPITRLPATIESPSGPGASLDAVVTTTESFAGEDLGTQQWTHSLAELDDGTFGHVFTAVFPVDPGNSYTLRVTRSDGVAAVATTTVPKIDQVLILDLGPLTVNADTTQVEQIIVSPPQIASPWNIRVIYNFASVRVNERVFVPYGRVGEPTEAGGWRFTIDPSQDQPQIAAAIVRTRSLGLIGPDDQVTLTHMGVDYGVLDAAWNPPGGVFDAEAFSQPGTFSNVENGYGFFGSIGFYRQEWNTEVHADIFDDEFLGVVPN